MKFVLLLIVAIVGYLYATGKLQKMMNRDYGQAMDEKQARALLGIAPFSNRDVIIRAHKDMMAKHHPDIGGNAEIARQINEARDVLLRSLPKKDLK